MYYNIHTHKIKTDSLNEEKSVLNVYPEDFESAKKISGAFYFSCGVHPWYSDDAEDRINILKDILNNEEVVAVGEVGLDKLRGPSINIQMQVLESQIELAEQVQKPLIIHCVKAWDELILLYKKHKGSIPWILHGYRGNSEQTKQFAKLGFKFSIGEKFNEDSLRYIPHNSIFCETDESDISICNVYENIYTHLKLSKDQFDYLIAENIAENIILLTK